MSKKVSNIPNWLIRLQSHESLAVREIAYEIAILIKDIPINRRKKLESWVEQTIGDFDFSLPNSEEIISESRATHGTPALVLETAATRGDWMKYKEINQPECLAVGAEYFLGSAAVELGDIEGSDFPHNPFEPMDRVFADWPHAILIVSEILGAQKHAAAIANQIANTQRENYYKNPKNRKFLELKWRFIRYFKKTNSQKAIKCIAEDFYNSLSIKDQEYYADVDSAVRAFMHGLRKYNRGTLYHLPGL